MNVRFPAWFLAVAVLAAAWLSGCTSLNADDSRPVERTKATADTSSTVPKTSDLIGVWTVVGHYIPGISAMSDTDAAAWDGQTVRLTAAEAISPGTRCDQPAYATRMVARDNLLAEGFHLSPTSLAPLASLKRLALLEVSCHGAPWAAMGGQLIQIDADHLLAPWDGVFFKLQRDHDFRALGQEPFWRLDIAKGKEIRFVQLGKPDVVTPVPRPTTDRVTGAQVFHATTEATDLRVVIEPTPCTDVMSGKRFETTVTVTLNKQTYLGCGGN
jgi:hypothetical protein